MIRLVLVAYTIVPSVIEFKVLFKASSLSSPGNLTKDSNPVEGIVLNSGKSLSNCFSSRINTS